MTPTVRAGGTTWPTVGAPTSTSFASILWTGALLVALGILGYLIEREEMEGQSLSNEALDELAAVVTKEPGSVVTRDIEDGTISAEGLGGARIRLRFHGISRDTAAAIAVRRSRAGR
jgi:hypothetical protein